MSNNVSSVMQPRAGLCPHGMPPSACPVCSNMGGGGSRKKELNFKSAQMPMMSWNQCEAIGYFLKSQRRAAENNRLKFKLLTLQLQLQADNFRKMKAKMEQFVSIINSFPGGFIIAIPLKIFVIPPLQFMSSTLVKIIDISDKIAAIYGEILKGLEKAKEKFNEFVKEIKNKFFKLFEIFGAENNRDKNKTIDEEKKIFNFNKLLRKLRKKRNKEQNET